MRWWATRGLSGVLAVSFIALAVQVAGAASPAINWTKAGFRHTIAQLVIQPNQAAAVTIGTTHVFIPAGALGPHPALFKVLMGNDRMFQHAAPRGQTVIANFALDVTDVVTGHPILKFMRPITYRLTQRGVSVYSVYWNAAPTSPARLVKNPVPATISGDTLTHEIIGAPWGWVVTSPRNG